MEDFKPKWFFLIKIKVFPQNMESFKRKELFLTKIRVSYQKWWGLERKLQSFEPN